MGGPEGGWEAQKEDVQIFDVTKGEEWDHVEGKMKATCPKSKFLKSFGSRTYGCGKDMMPIREWFGRTIDQ